MAILSTLYSKVQIALSSTNIYIAEYEVCWIIVLSKTRFNATCSLVRRTTNVSTKLLLHCRSFDNEYDKQRDKTTLSPATTDASRRKSEESKSSPVANASGFFKFRSSIEGPSISIIKVFKYKEIVIIILSVKAVINDKFECNTEFKI